MRREIRSERMAGNLKLDCAIVRILKPCPFSFTGAVLVGARGTGVHGLRSSPVFQSDG